MDSHHTTESEENPMIQCIRSQKGKQQSPGGEIREGSWKKWLLGWVLNNTTSMYKEAGKAFQQNNCMRKAQKRESWILRQEMGNGLVSLKQRNQGKIMERQQMNWSASL